MDSQDRSRTGPGTGPGTSPETSPVVSDQGTGPGVWSWNWSRTRDQSQDRRDWSQAQDQSWDRSGSGIESQFKLLCCHLKPLQTPFRTGTQDTGQGPRSSLPATKPARAVMDVLVVVEDPWIYSARESNTSSQPATSPGQLREGQFQGDPGRGDCSRPTRSDLGASRPKR